MAIQMHTAMNQVQLLNGYPRTGHMTPSCMTLSQVTKTFSSITPHGLEVEPWASCHCICLVKTHRSICHMTYLGHLSGQVMPWPKVKISDWPFGVRMHMFRCVLMREIRWYFAFFLSFLVQKLFAKKLIFQKCIIFCLACPGKVKMWPKIVKSGMGRFKTSRSFRWSLLQSSISIRGQASRGVLPPRCGLGWRNRRCGRGLNMCTMNILNIHT